MWHTWWHFSTQFSIQSLAVMGFITTQTSTHQQYHRGKAHTAFYCRRPKIVKQRRAGPDVILLPQSWEKNL